MQDIIEKLYRGELYPAEKINPAMQDFKEKWQKARNEELAFESKLSEEMKSEFQAIMVDKMGVTVLEQTQAFVDGFRYGAKILIEVFMSGNIEAENE